MIHKEQFIAVMGTNSKFAAGAVFLLYNSAGAGYFSYNSAGFALALVFALRWFFVT